ncbi:hypothetical protein FHG87_001414 [Trinorchestia longiramus]|nr:hypothetical protein FHG87_001414 [Trinorchestia longiramus]
MIVQICELGGGSCKEDYPLPLAYEHFGADPERRAATGMSMPYAMQMVKAEQKRRSQDGPPPMSPPDEPSAGSSASSGQSPMVYSIKMMNSIWGMYNKYSVHNFKSKLCEGTHASAGNESGMAGMFGGQSQASVPEPGFLTNTYDMLKFYH